MSELIELIGELSPEDFAEALPTLSQALEQVEAREFALAERFRQLDRRLYWSAETLYEDEQIHLSLFLLPKGHKIPIHDHPEMTVLLRVLWGRAAIVSYDWAREHPFEGLARTVFEDSVDGSHNTLVVRPDRGNLHSIEAEQDLAFLDLFSPYYCEDSGRICRYYRKRGEVERGGERLTRLVISA